MDNVTSCAHPVLELVTQIKPDLEARNCIFDEPCMFSSTERFEDKYLKGIACSSQNIVSKSDAIWSIMVIS